ncbi:MAG: ABC transporter substrate-binding protein [Acidimicrobiales bacterium]
MAAVATVAAACGGSSGGGSTTTTKASASGSSTTAAPSGSSTTASGSGSSTTASGPASPGSFLGGAVTNGSTTGNKASAPGITTTQILLGSTQPLTGPAAPGYDEISPGSNAIFQYVNAHGGIYGRKIKYLVENDQYDPAITATATRKLVLQDNIFADFNPLGTPTDIAIQPFLNSQKVPQLFIASGCACWSDPKYPWSSGWQTNYIIEGKILGKYIVDHYKGEKVGYIYQNDEFGQDGVKGLDLQIPKSDVVSRQTYDTTTLSAGLGNQVAALKSAGVKVAVLYTIPAATTLTLLAAAEIGYHPQWVVSSVGADPPTLTGLLKSISKGKAGGSLLNGMVSNDYLPAESDYANPWVAAFRTIWKKYDTGQPWDGNTEYGMAVGYTMVELLAAAGRNPTRASLMTTLETDGSHFPGPGLVPLSYSSTDHYGYQGSQIGVTENGTYTLSGPVYVSTNNGPITTYTGTPTTPPTGFGS